MSPTPAISCPTGKAEPDRSEAAFVMLNPTRFSDKFATSLGEISINSSGVPGTLIVSTTRRTPFTQTNSLYVFSPSPVSL